MTDMYDDQLELDEADVDELDEELEDADGIEEFDPFADLTDEELDALSWVLVILCIGLVIFAELVNTSIEAVVDLATQELDPLAKRAKDIAAASVFTLSITAAIVGIIVFARAILLL